MNIFRYSNSLKVGDFVTVLISDVNYLDGSFCVTTCPSHYNSIDQLINHNNAFNGDNSLNTRSFRKNHIEPNIPCLVRYGDSKLYRAIIVECQHIESDHVCVYFVDFGNIWQANKSDIFEIDDFLVNNVPVSMHVCKLFNVRYEDSTNIELISSYTKDLTNFNDSIITIKVKFIQNNIHFVEVFKYSLQSFLNFNNYINTLLGETNSITLEDDISDKIQVQSKNDTNAFENSNNKSYENKGKPSLDIMCEFVTSFGGFEDFLINENVKPIKIDICNLISPFEFYCVPISQESLKFYDQFFDEMNLHLKNNNDTKTTSNLINTICAYYNSQQSKWFRCKVISINQKNQDSVEYGIIDYDSFQKKYIEIKLDEKSKYFKNLHQKFLIPSQAVHCIIANFQPKVFSLSKIMIENEFKNFIQKYVNNLYIIPLEYRKNSFIINLYGHETIHTRLIENRHHFISYPRILLDKSIISFCQVKDCSIKIDDFKDIYRNSVDNYVFLTELPKDEELTEHNVNYLRPLYPNHHILKGHITHVKTENSRTIIYFRYSQQNHLYEKIRSSISKLLEKGIQILKRIQQNLYPLDPCLVHNISTDQWYRAEVVGIKKDPITSLFKVQVFLIDVGRTELCFIENLYDYFVEPLVPSLAIPVYLVKLNQPTFNLPDSNRLIGNTVKINWTNFPNLPMEVECFEEDIVLQNFN